MKLFKIYSENVANLTYKGHLIRLFFYHKVLAVDEKKYF